MLNDAMIQCENFTKRFGNFMAADHASFLVDKCSVFGFLGLNGLEKMTVVHILCRILESSHGRAQIAGVNVVRATDRIKAAIGQMWQEFSLCDELMVNENLLFYGRLYGLRGEALRHKPDDAGRRTNMQLARQVLAKLQECWASEQR